MAESPSFDYANSCVIITGGTKGLGRGIAEAFLEAGASVVVCARNEPDEPVVASSALSPSPQPPSSPSSPSSAQAETSEALFVPADVREPDDVKRVVDAALEAYGRIDVLINNAGGAPPVSSSEASPRFNERVVALNLLAPIMFSQAVHPTMMAQDSGGVILNISSEAALRPNPYGVAYGAAKAGLINVSETLSVEWGPKIRVLTVTAGLLVTESAHLFYGDEEGIQKVGETIALGRMGDPEDIADVCLFLASPMAGWMTGANVKVHGGGEKPAYLDASTGDVKSA